MVENCIGLQMLRIIISIFIFISPVIFCENEIEVSGHFESPETEAYDWHLGNVWEILTYMAVAGTVQLVVKLKDRPFSFKMAFHVEGNSYPVTRLPQTLNIF